MQPSGVVLYPKPSGVTSHDVVAQIRRRYPRRTKVGHAGTLDPLATGLLLVLVGQATRAQRFFTQLRKTYRVTARLGWLSDTGDREGKLTHTGRVPVSLALQTGTVWQRPPAYSAVKVGGERMYKRARRGEDPDAAARPVTVYRFECVWRDEDRLGLEIECSSGTYVRALVAGLEDAYCEQITRTAVGPFDLSRADENTVVPLERALCFLPERRLEAVQADGVAKGRALAGATEPAGSHVRLTYQGKLVAIAEVTEDRALPRVVFGL